jgi:hypothetical protein
MWRGPACRRFLLGVSRSPSLVPGVSWTARGLLATLGTITDRARFQAEGITYVVQLSGNPALTDGECVKLY